MQVLAFVAGLGAMVALFFIYQQPERKKLIVAKLCADACWSVHYFCLGAYGGIVPNFMGIFRELTFMQRDKKRWASLPVIPIIFIVANFLIGVFTFSRPINILPITASAFVTVSLWLRNPRLTKIISIPVSLTFFIYDIFVNSYIGMLSETIAIISIIINICNERKRK